MHFWFKMINENSRLECIYDCKIYVELINTVPIASKDMAMGTGERGEQWQIQESQW